MQDIITIILLTLLPFLELRASIPWGIASGMNPFFVFVVAVLCNIVLAPILYWFLDTFLHILCRIKLINDYYHKKIEKLQKKIHKKVEKYGEWALALFIGIPLPGSGVYSGALIAYALGMSKKKFYIAAVLGVLIAAILVTIASFIGTGIFQLFINN